MLAKDLSGRTVIVTAGAAGIGLSIAQRFVAEGANVAVCDISSAALERASKALPEVRLFQVDVADLEAVAGMIAAVGKEFGTIDALVNNAGVAGPIGPVEVIDSKAWSECFAVNVQGAFHMIREVVPYMRRQGAGSIINISTASTQTFPLGRSPYVASKWALEGLTKSGARELGPSGIRVNAIRPGFMDTPRMVNLLTKAAEEKGVSLEQIEQESLSYISMRSKVQPEEIGAMALFLASDAARNISGQIIGVCGNAEWE